MATPPTGRPRGRPRGTASKRREAIREAIEAAAPDLIDGLIASAKDGDTAAAVALLDRCAPRLRPTAMAVVIDLSGTPEEVGERVLSAVGHGAVPVDLGKDLVDLVRSTRQGTPEAITPVDTDALDKIYANALEQAAERQEALRLERQGLYDGIATGEIPT